MNICVHGFYENCPGCKDEHITALEAALKECVESLESCRDLCSDMMGTCWQEDSGVDGATFRPCFDGCQQALTHAKEVLK